MVMFRQTNPTDKNGHPVHVSNYEFTGLRPGDLSDNPARRTVRQADWINHGGPTDAGRSGPHTGEWRVVSFAVGQIPGRGTGFPRDPAVGHQWL